MSHDVDEFPGRLLHQAALWDNAELLEDLLASESQLPYINGRDAWGRTALHAAATTHGSRCLRVLLQAGGAHATLSHRSRARKIEWGSCADADIPCGPRGDCRTALHMAAEHGHLSNVSLLLEHGADLLARDRSGLTASDLAEHAEHTDTMQLLRRVADAREREKLAVHSALREACACADVIKTRAIIKQLGRDLVSVVNMTPDGCCSLLYKAASDGHTAIVRMLLESGADGRLQSVTRYSPLYIAAYNGRTQVVQLLLKWLPELVECLSVERWSPLHACCITGRVSILHLLLHYEYPSQVLTEYRDTSGRFRYRLPFDINATDMEGQTPLYQACCVGNVHLVETLVKFRVRAEKIQDDDTDCAWSRSHVTDDVTTTTNNNNNIASGVVATAQQSDTDPPLSSQQQQQQQQQEQQSVVVRRRISHGIQALMNRFSFTGDCDARADSRLGVDAGGSGASSSSHTTPALLIQPLNVNMYCNNNAETALHVAVRCRQHNVVSLLLCAGADPNLCRRSMSQPSSATTSHATNTHSTNTDEEHSGPGFQECSALTEACSTRDLAMVELLLKHGARDTRQFAALHVACRHADVAIVARLLALRSHADPDYQVVGPVAGCGRGAGESVVPVVIDWRSDRCLQQLRVGWLSEAVWRLNPRLKSCCGSAARQRSTINTALATITRLDVSNNSLTELPVEILQMRSLRHLSVSQNKLEKICPPSSSCDDVDQSLALGFDSTSLLPVLEEINLQDNRLQHLPAFLFSLPRLCVLDASNNKLTSLPLLMWTSPALREFNLSFNMLATLPTPVCDEQCAVCASQVSPARHSEMASVEQGVCEKNTATYGTTTPQPRQPVKFSKITALRSNRKLRSASEDRARVRSSHSGGVVSQRPRSQSRRRIMMTSSSSASSSASTGRQGVLSAVNIDINSACSGVAGGLLRRTEVVSVGVKRRREVQHDSIWRGRVDICDAPDVDTMDTLIDGAAAAAATLTPSSGAVTQHRRSRLQSLNLSHNNFDQVPAGLACLALSLTRLNLSYNCLTDMGCVSDYPSSLRQLDMSHNRINKWPDAAAICCQDAKTLVSHLSERWRCYATHISDSLIQPAGLDGGSPASTKSTNTQRSSTGDSAHCRSSANQLTATGSVVAISPAHNAASANQMCRHRRHRRFESLRSLLLAGNLLSEIQLTDQCQFGDQLMHSVTSSTVSAQRGDGCSADDTGRLLYPHLSVLDVSGNCLRRITSSISRANTLSVLNISSNKDVNELPPQMGLLSRLWNLNTRGCCLHEPLRSMIDSHKYKTMDVVGYLKSVLEDARHYARMKLMIVGVQGIGKTSLLEQLRHEGTGSFRKRPPEHWAKRMGNKNINLRTASGTILSTVGVDICDWTFEKRVSRGQTSLGPVTFRTWDFGGQREYYATHQYFLSRRSLYLAVWRITDGERGVNNIHQWLVNIQARAPNSPVIIVGTHYDVAREKFSSSQCERWQHMIRCRFMNLVDADKCGLPRVMDTIEVSCRTRHNIALLCAIIYDTVFSLKSPGSKERLLEQKIPATYLALEDVTAILASECHAQGRDPVLTGQEYRTLVGREMSARFNLAFRDPAELNQATAFLHENGVVLHYDDATLKDLYFLDPQWLCDMLSHVVTVREINPFAPNGVMRLDDMRLLFRSSSCAPLNARAYIVSLLDKFEVAVTWDARTLLIPSLLPSEEMMRCGSGAGTDVRIPVRCRGWALRRRAQSANKLATSDASGCLPISSSCTADDPPVEPPARDVADCSVTRRCQPSSVVRRLYMMTYFPSGFWSRLISRLLADDAIIDAVRAYFVVPRQVQQDSVFSAVLRCGGASTTTTTTTTTATGAAPAEWRCWQTGIELRHAGTTLVRVRELLGYLRYSPDYRTTRMLVYQEQQWQPVCTADSAILEISLPHEALVLRKTCPVTDLSCQPDADTGAAFNSPHVHSTGIQSAVLEANPECAARLLAAVVEHIDTLLEDWYPSLGTRFAHTSEGRLLVTRLVPCPLCLLGDGAQDTGAEAGDDDTSRNLGDDPSAFSGRANSSSDCMSSQRHVVKSGDGGRMRDSNSCQLLADFEILSEASLAAPSMRPLVEAGGVSCGYHSDGDSGVGPDSASSSRQASSQGRTADQTRREPQRSSPSPPPSAQPPPTTVYGFLVEECILTSCSGRHVSCPRHGQQLLSQLAPDTMFMDVGERFLVRTDSLKIGPMLGRGAFGFVFRATHRHRADGRYFDVAIKTVQPSDPGNEARDSVIAAYKASRAKWERDPIQYSCKAYCTVRQELNILLTLRHPYIVPLVGVCVSPLSLVLELAPQGALDACLLNYRRCGDRLAASVMQLVLLQVAKALEYLHQQRIIYRDLKSENVLVWSLPPPFHSSSSTSSIITGNASVIVDTSPVHVKLADYGISRSTLPVGTKGFAGTEGFMAPEIVRFNGEEEYTEKVDCFSFGMFIYELVSLRQPFDGFESIKEHILEGRRPPLTSKEVGGATYLLDLMVLCWSAQPALRPSASQLVSIVTAPEFSQLTDSVPLDSPLAVHAALAVHTSATTTDTRESSEGAQVWIARAAGQLDIVSVVGHQVAGCVSMQLPQTVVAAAQIGPAVWLGDNRGVIRGYCVESHELIFTYAVEPDGIDSAAGESVTASVCSICPLTGLDRVAVALSNGRLFITRSDVVPDSSTRGEGSFVVTELGSACDIISCLEAVCISSTFRCDELWCGQRGGQICVYCLEDSVVVSQDTVAHFASSAPDSAVMTSSVHCIVAPTQHQTCEELWSGVWTCVLPGCVVYHWHAASHSVMARLDCSRLMPVSESLASISDDQQLTVEQSQVVCLSVAGRLLYMGSQWGCLLVADAVSMLPLTVFRPHQQPITHIVCLCADTVTAAGHSPDCAVDRVLTLGGGYRPLPERHCQPPGDALHEVISRRSHYLLVWRADQWSLP